MATNYIYQFAGDIGALVLSDGDFASDGQRPIGNQPGIARADFVNKAMRQTSYMATILAQFIVDNAVEDVLDSESITLGVAHLVTAVSLTSGFAAGTRLTFFQAAPPTAWTQVTTYTDMALRVVSTAGGGIGGTHDFSTPPSLAHVHATASHVLDTTEMPAHTHTRPNHLVYIPGVTDGSEAAIQWSTPSSAGITGSTGGGLGHDHGNVGSTTPTAFAPKYIDVILCTKN